MRRRSMGQCKGAVNSPAETETQMFGIVLLFVLLTPGILITLPPGSRGLVPAVVHGIVFAVLLAYRRDIRVLREVLSLADSIY